jgi:hypothetical protein
MHHRLSIAITKGAWLYLSHAPFSLEKNAKGDCDGI